MNKKADRFPLWLVLTLLVPHASHGAATECVRKVKNALQGKPPASVGDEVAVPEHPLGPEIDRWQSHKPNEKTEFSAVTPGFFAKLHENAATVVTVGGTSINVLFSDHTDSAKVKYSHPPKSTEELATWIADGAAPELKRMAKEGKFKGGVAPIVIVPMPGFVIKNESVVLPGNFGEIGNAKGLSLVQSRPGHAAPVPLSRLVSMELAKRARALGIPEGQLKGARIYLENDALPIVANAAYTKLSPGETASVIFVGTGTGSAKVRLKGKSAFEMLSSEESQTKLETFPKAATEAIPDHVRLGAMIANGPSLTLENVTGGGRTLGETRNHLSGANSVALSFLLPQAEMPKWIRERVAGDYDKYRKKMLKSLGYEEKDLKKLTREGSPDAKLLEDLRKNGSLGVKEIRAAGKVGSELAQRILEDDSYTQGLVAGLITLNVGETPSGNVIPPELVYSNETKDGHYELKMLVRASAGLNSWSHDHYFHRAEKGIEAAKNILLEDDAYRKKLKALGLKPPKAKHVRIKVKRIFSDDLTEHPDFTGLDTFSESLRAGMAP